MSGEVLKAYETFSDWGLLDSYPIDNEDGDHLRMYITILAMIRYRHLEWKEKVPERKLSKWEIVNGVKPKR